MPVNIANELPAREILNNENIFVMTEERARRQDIRPLRIAILNLMPTKINTETQLLRLLGNTSIQVNITLLHPRSHKTTYKNTSKEHLVAFYQTFDDVKHFKFDGLVITGAPVENFQFEHVDYWDELTEIMDWSEEHVFSTFFICWGAQAGLYHKFGIPKYPLDKKMFGVFEHRVCAKKEKIMRGFDDLFYAPHSRHTEIRKSDIEQVPELKIFSDSEDAGVYIVGTTDERQIFVTGHSEYDPLTLKSEYERDAGKGLPIEVPRNYYPGNDPKKEPVVRWRSHANLLYANWLNYYVYQETPFDVDRIPKKWDNHSS